MKQPANLIGQQVTLNADLLDLKARPHPHAGKQVTILNKTRKTYVADPGDNTTTVFFDGDFTVTPIAEGTAFIHVAGVSSEIITVPPGELRESPFNPRKFFAVDPLAELTESIKQVGIMSPLLVRWVEISRKNGVTIEALEIVYGHRRCRAAVAAGLLDVPVMVRRLTDAQASRLQAIENLQREDLNPIEEAQGYADYCRDHKVSKQELADHIGVSRTTIYNQLKLLDLSPEGQALVQRGVLGTELAMEVARIGGPEVQAPVLSRIFHGAALDTVTKDSPALSLRQGVKLIEGIGSQAERKPAKPAAFNMLQHLARQHAFSEKTFGPGVRTAGVINHIRKELVEIEAAPLDLTEWIDVVILALDGAWRAGGSPEQIVAALVAKQAKNEARTWPDWRNAPKNKAIQHLKPQ